MNLILQKIAEILGGIAISTLDSYSWVGMYEPKIPKELLHYKKIKK